MIRACIGKLDQKSLGRHRDSLDDAFAMQSSGVYLVAAATYRISLPLHARFMHGVV